VLAEATFARLQRRYARHRLALANARHAAGLVLPTLPVLQPTSASDIPPATVTSPASTAASSTNEGMPSPLCAASAAALATLRDERALWDAELRRLAVEWTRLVREHAATAGADADTTIAGEPSSGAAPDGQVGQLPEPQQVSRAWVDLEKEKDLEYWRAKRRSVRNLG